MYQGKLLSLQFRKLTKIFVFGIISLFFLKILVFLSHFAAKLTFFPNSVTKFVRNSCFSWPFVVVYFSWRSVRKNYRNLKEPKSFDVRNVPTKRLMIKVFGIFEVFAFSELVEIKHHWFWICVLWSWKSHFLLKFSAFSLLSYEKYGHAAVPLFYLLWGHKWWYCNSKLFVGVWSREQVNVACIFCGITNRTALYHFMNLSGNSCSSMKRLLTFIPHNALKYFRTMLYKLNSCLIDMFG